MDFSSLQPPVHVQEQKSGWVVTVIEVAVNHDLEFFARLHADLRYVEKTDIEFESSNS